MENEVKVTELLAPSLRLAWRDLENSGRSEMDFTWMGRQYVLRRDGRAFEKANPRPKTTDRQVSGIDDIESAWKKVSLRH
jgi:hypothetical protein